ncbi:reverse transcriptase [Cucumis melo var. makuwa]|uniref:Reverse transcriptase n=1 Tax=Cucumis melo var. makuwa TaxID=1194695 RepID=A0A5D3CWR2_CUCMM|nr:reverse transcriptase [Cucumis melo var. makuwa]TYK15374.1 reverse transcriptase [Cucumis melo var. makuwa]
MCEKNESREFCCLTYCRTSRTNDDKVGGWNSLVDFVVVKMDDFDVVLGMEFLLEHQKGLTRDKLTFMAIPLDPLKNLGETGPKDILCVLEKYRDVILDSLPKSLSPRRMIDHEIELVPRAKPPAKNAYHLRSGYYQVRIAEEDKPRTTCVTRYRAFEFLVMRFSLTNAPATFCTLMNQVFHEYLDKFVVVYLDNIVVNSSTMEEHRDHLQKSVAELEWKKGRLLHYMTGQYQNHSRSYAPSSAAFDGLKQVMMKGSILRIADVTKPFEVETDAFDYALGDVL